MPCIVRAQTTRPKLIHRSAIVSKKKQQPEVWPPAIYIEELNAKSGRPISHDLVNIWLYEIAPLWPPNHYPYSGPTSTWQIKRTNHQGRIMIPISKNDHGGGISILSANHHDCRPPIYDNSVIPHYPRPAQSQVYLLTKIISSGIVAENTCGKAEARSKPGTLIIFVRSFTFWERWRM